MWRYPFLAISALMLANISAIGCGKKKKVGGKFEPRLTYKLMPPPLKGLLMDQTTLEEAQERFPMLVLYKDQRLGGKSKRLEVCQKPAVLLKTAEGAQRGAPSVELSFIKRHGALRLVSITYRSPRPVGLCAWVTEHIGSRPGAKESPDSNVVYGKTRYGVRYAGGTSDGKSGVQVSCDNRSGPEELALSVSIGEGCGFLGVGLEPEKR